jgi:hypothetical protein
MARNDHACVTERASVALFAIALDDRDVKATLDAVKADA